jgi:hypothetical protein
MFGSPSHIRGGRSVSRGRSSYGAVPGGRVPGRGGSSYRPSEPSVGPGFGSPYGNGSNGIVGFGQRPGLPQPHMFGGRPDFA